MYLIKKIHVSGFRFFVIAQISLWVPAVYPWYSLSACRFPGVCEQRRLRSDCADAHADRLHMFDVPFYLVRLSWYIRDNSGWIVYVKCRCFMYGALEYIWQFNKIIELIAALPIIGFLKPGSYVWRNFMILFIFACHWTEIPAFFMDFLFWRGVSPLG